jgi:hypothetical protein
MGGAATVPAGQYLSKEDNTTDSAILAQKQGMGNTALDIARQDLNAAQSGALQTQAGLFDLYTKSQPLMQDFDAEQTSRQAAQFGLSNEARTRQGEELLSPATARMRYQLPEQIEAVTSDESFKNRMDAWLKNKGISAVSGTGVDPSSSFGRSMLADVSTEEGRKRMLEDIELRNRFVSSQQRPTGGIDPGTLIGARMGQEAANLGAMADWQKNIFSGAQQLGGTLNEFDQARMGLNQNAFDYLSKNMGEILNLSNVQRQNRQAYEQSLYNAAVQNAQSQNASKAGMISAGAGIGGAAIGAAAIII